MDNEEQVKQLKEGKQKALKLVSKWKRNARKEQGQDLNDLWVQLNAMETDNEVLKEEIEKLLCKKPIKTFKDGWYTDEMREVFHYFTAQGITCRKVEPLLHKVLDKLVNEEIERPAKKNFIDTMPIEADLLSKMHVGAMLQYEPNSTLHGTTKKFSEFSTFNTTTQMLLLSLWALKLCSRVEALLMTTWILHEIYFMTLQGCCYPKIPMKV